MNKNEYKSESVRALIFNASETHFLVECYEPKNIYYLPGGTIETGENHKDALVRELVEEVQGAKIEILEYLGKIGHKWKYNSKINGCLNYFYKGKLIEGKESDIFTNEENRRLEWFDVSEPNLSLVPPSLHKAIKKYQSNAFNEWEIEDSET